MLIHGDGKNNMEEMRVQIFSDFAPSSGLRNAFKSWAGGKTEYKNMKIVDDDSYTHAVIYNLGMPNLSIPKNRVVAFQHEPYEILNYTPMKDYVRQFVGTYFVHDKSRFQDVSEAKEGVCYLAPHLTLGENPHEYSPVKTQRMSIILSEKGYLPGHALRHKIVQRILRTNMDVHIFGRGSPAYHDPRVKGPVDHKANAFLPYEFCIAIENAIYPYWCTEKFYDGILGLSTPLYWGGHGAGQWFGTEGFIQLPSTTNADVVFSAIQDVYHNPERHRKDTLTTQQKLYKEKNFAHFLWEHFTNAM